jgi:hypothetical protein
MGQQAEAYSNAIKASGLDFGALDLVEKTIKGDNKGAAVAAVLFVANVATLGHEGEAVVIGERMAARVEPAAEALGARVYKPIAGN